MAAEKKVQEVCTCLYIVCMHVYRILTYSRYFGMNLLPAWLALFTCIATATTLVYM